MAVSFAAIPVLGSVGKWGKVAKAASWLAKGERTSVYIGYVDGVAKYVGITKDIARRTEQWAGKYRIEEIASGLSRNQARSIEQNIIQAQGSNFNNKINSISSNREIYQAAIDWGQNYIKNNSLSNWLNP